MSKRQPTIEINDRIIAHDEIVEIIDLENSPATGKEGNYFAAIRLINGAIVPLPAQKVDRLISFLDSNEH